VDDPAASLVESALAAMAAADRRQKQAEIGRACHGFRRALEQGLAEVERRLAEPAQASAALLGRLDLSQG
jgi:hypothetical protein